MPGVWIQMADEKRCRGAPSCPRCSSGNIVKRMKEYEPQIILAISIFWIFLLGSLVLSDYFQPDGLFHIITLIIAFLMFLT